VKDRKARIPDVSVVRYMLDGSIGAAAPSTPAVAANSRMSFLWQAAAVISLLLAMVAGAAWYRARSVVPPSASFLIDAPENTTFMVGRRSGTAAAISPDGRTLAFAVRDGSGKLLLWLRPIAALAAHPLPGTDGASYPFWSPDGRWIAYTTGGKLMKVSAAGGQPQELATAPSQAIIGRGGAWNLENVIVFSKGPGGLHRVSSSGGQTQPVGREVPGVTGFLFPSFLPDGRHVLAYGESADEGLKGLYVVSLDTGESKRILGTTTGGIYSPETGHLVYGRDGILLAQRFDPVAFTVAGDPIAIGERLEDGIVPGMIAFSVSHTGVLAYGTSSPADIQSELVWIGRNGAVQGTLAQAAPYLGVELSPDGRHVAVHQHEGDGGDIWVIEVSTGRPIRFTTDARQDNWSPVWSRDGTRIAFTSRRTGNLGVYIKPWNMAGDEMLQFEPDRKTTLGARPWSWSPVDDSIVQSITDVKAQASLYRVPLSGDRRPVPLTERSGRTLHGQISPDGRWLAYTSVEVGETRVHVRSLASGARWPVSTGRGVMPRWRRDGRELFYLGESSLMAVDVTTSGPAFEAGKPHALFEHGSAVIPGKAGHLDGFHFTYAADADGQRFLMARPPAGAARESKQQPIAVVLNWAEGLKQQ
jgi:Tol biopolymer transport system component